MGRDPVDQMRKRWIDLVNENKKKDFGLGKHEGGWMTRMNGGGM